MSQLNSKRRVPCLVFSVLALLLGTAPTTIAEPTGIQIVGPEGLVVERPEPVSPQIQSFGPVQASDTLWRIASVTRPDPRISVYQMMYAIYQKNPQAFENGNIHKLTRGSTLSIPTTQEALRVANQQASQQLSSDQKLLEKVAKPAPKTESAVSQSVEPVTADLPEPKVSSESEPTEVATPVTVEESVEQPQAPVAINNLERTRKLYDIRLQELKGELADSIGSIEALLEQNRFLSNRIEELSETISTLEEALEKGKAESGASLSALEAKADAAQLEVQKLAETTPSNLWLWLLSVGLAAVFGLIGWLILLSRKTASAEPQQALNSTTETPLSDELSLDAQELPEEDSEPEPEEDILLDLGLDDEAVDEPIDLSSDESDDLPDMVDLDSLDGEELLASSVEDTSVEVGEIEGLLARDSDLSEPDVSDILADIELGPQDSVAEMQEIQTLDLDLDAEGGELTQEALDALAGMENLADLEEAANEEELPADLEEAFDAIGQPQPEEQLTESEEPLAESKKPLAEEPLAEQKEPSAEYNESSAEEIDIDALLAESAPEVPQETVEEESFDIDALLEETQEEPSAEYNEPSAEYNEPSGEELDIDELLAESAPDAPQETAEDEESFDIDTLLEEAQEEPSARKEPSAESESLEIKEPIDESDEAFAELGAELDAAAATTAEDELENVDLEFSQEQADESSTEGQEFQVTVPEHESLEDETEYEVSELAAELDAEVATTEAEDADVENNTDTFEQSEADDSLQDSAEIEFNLEADITDDEEAFDLDALLEESASQPEVSEQALEESALDIDSLLNSEEPEEAPAPEHAMSADELEQEFNLENIAEQLLADDELESHELAAELDTDESISAEEIAAQLTGLSPEITGQAEPTSTTPEELVDIDQLIAEAEVAEPVADSDTLLPGELEGIDELEDEDEVAAKLDLARAYIEIGDQEIAKQLLQQIILGDEEQHKIEAQKLLDQL